MSNWTTTASTYGAAFSRQTQYDGILAFLNGGDYAPEVLDTLSEALFDALRDEVDARLPIDVRWQPATSEFTHPVDLPDSDPESDLLPEREQMTELFEQAWAAVEARFDDIERAALAASSARP